MLIQPLRPNKAQISSQYDLYTLYAAFQATAHLWADLLALDSLCVRGEELASALLTSLVMSLWPTSGDFGAIKLSRRRWPGPGR